MRKALHSARAEAAELTLIEDCVSRPIDSQHPSLLPSQGPLKRMPATDKQAKSWA